MGATAKVYTGTCDTMTFEEAWKAITTGKPINFVGYTNENSVRELLPLSDKVVAVNNCIGIKLGDITLYWTPDGISSVRPSSAK